MHSKRLYQKKGKIQFKKCQTSATEPDECSGDLGGRVPEADVAKMAAGSSEF